MQIFVLKDKVEMELDVIYSVYSSLDECSNKEYQLQELPARISYMSLGVLGGGETKQYYKNTSLNDYDNLFVSKIKSLKLKYDTTNLLNFHLQNCTKNKGGNNDTFIKHIKYHVLPLFKNDEKNAVYRQIITEWIDDKNQTKSNMNGINVSNTNGTIQLILDSPNSNQSMNISISNNDIMQLLELIKLDVENINNEAKDDLLLEIYQTEKSLKNNKDFMSRLKTIGSLVKDIGINLFVNLLSSSIFESSKQSLGL